MILIIILSAIALAAAVVSSIVLKIKRNERSKCRSAAEVLMHYEILTMKLRSSYGENPENADKIMLYLKCIDKVQGVRAVFNPENKICFGRDPHTNEVFVEDMTVSGNHCRIEEVNGRVYLTDLMSSNGTVLKRGRFQKCTLSNGAKAELLSGDTIYVGSCEFKVILFSYNRFTM